MQLGAWAESTPLPEGPDASSLEGARRLAEKINAIYQARGLNANARPVLLPFSKSMREAYYVIRSDLVNGLPRERQP
jgi:hypothetical protein